MRNFYSKLFFLMLPILASGQLYIGEGSSNSYVYNKGEIVFVTQDVNLQGDPDQEGGNFYLREEGQLIQGNESSLNEGNGIVSVFQQNTRNKWDYHYWSSPVGDPTNTIPLSNTGTNGFGNSDGKGNSRFYQPDDNNGGIYQPLSETSIESNPVPFIGGYDSQIVSGSYEIPSYWLYKFVTSNSYGQWRKIDGTTYSLNPGEGFTMKGIGTDISIAGVERSLDFRGRPNNGTIKVAVANEQLTLVGNPYPSAMNLSYYLLYNSGQSVTGCNLPYRSEITPTSGNQVITGAAYFWESDPTVQSHYVKDYQGGYGTFTPIDCSYSGSYAPAIFVKATNEGERALEPVPNLDQNGDPIYVDGNGDPIHADENGIPYEFVPDYDTDGNLQYDENGEIIYEMQTIATGKTGETIERRFAPVGQGFFIEGTTSGFATALNAFRVFVKESIPNKSQFKQSSSTTSTSKIAKNSVANEASALKAGAVSYDQDGFLILPEFNIEILINDLYIRRIKSITYDDSTLGFDNAKDGDNISELNTDISYVVENSERSVITNVFPYEIDVKLPLKVSGAAEINTYEMQVSELNFTPDESIYLHDKQTDEYHDILNESYEFELEKGTYTNRFEIVFKDAKTLDVEEIEEVKRSFNIYQNNGRAELTVLNPLETELKEINVFDISGRLLVSKLNEGTNSKVTIPSGAWSDGIYIIRVTTRENIEYSKKISVKNLK
ncbi:putative secreted protein (Por secretion system target) [Leeuwenhoekiella aestuarii]|nr:T9SS type A sorting domain-containing protein [Leeuwenhoekiella aestuarii]RXG17468.1 putative secreted protein (Por secretion system target) [Leeuwenhoekiella aestuarii]